MHKSVAYLIAKRSLEFAPHEVIIISKKELPKVFAFFSKSLWMKADCCDIAHQNKLQSLYYESNISFVIIRI